MKAERSQPSSERATLTPIESTRITGFGIQATYRMLQNGTIPHIKVGMRFYIVKTVLMKWLDEAAFAALHESTQ